MKVHIKKDKKTMIFAGGGLFLCLIVAVCFAIVANSDERKLAHQLELGQKYLGELNYEQALVAFEAAIEIDPMSARAYIGAADAYIGLGDLESAKAVLEQGMKIISNNSIEEKLEEVLNAIDRIEEEKDKETDLPEDKEAEVKYDSLLNAMRELIIAEDYEQANILVQSQEYKEMIDSLRGDESYYSGEYDENGVRNGLGISVHLNTYGAYFYYGSWDGGKRDGNGKAVFLTPDNAVCPYNIFTGEWADNLPNGEGEEWYRIIPPSEYEEYQSRCSLVRGTYKDGLYDGEIYHEETGWDGEIDIYRGTARMGVFTPLGENDNGLVEIMAREDGGGMFTAPEKNKGEGILLKILPPEN